MFDARVLVIAGGYTRRVAEGLALLEQSARGEEVTPYHLEAAIAAEHASAPTLAATNWAVVVSLYDKLLALSPSPVVALNRAIALAERDGVEGARGTACDR